MTPARILAVCRDEWPALRWRWEAIDCAVGAGRTGSAYLVAWFKEPAELSVEVDGADGSPRATGLYPLTERGVRRALREARRLTCGDP